MKNCTSEDRLVQTASYESRTFSELQILHACFTKLREWKFRNLSAPIWRWYRNDSAGAFITVAGRRIALEPRRVVLIPPHTVFSTETERPVGQLFVHFNLGASHIPEPNRVFSHSPGPGEMRMIRRLQHLLVHAGSNAQQEISFLSQALAAMALSQVPSGMWRGKVLDCRIEHALRSMRRHGDSGNADIAREVGMNVNAFTKSFRRATGHSPHQYRLMMRVEQACQLLSKGDSSLDEIAELTGFCDRFHFSRTFKQFMHATPAAFRRASRG